MVVAFVHHLARGMVHLRINNIRSAQATVCKFKKMKSALVCRHGRWIHSPYIGTTIYIMPHLPHCRALSHQPERAANLYPVGLYKRRAGWRESIYSH